MVHQTPSNHISRTITLLNGSSGCLKSFAKSSRRDLLRICGCQSSDLMRTGHHNFDDALSSSLWCNRACCSDGFVKLDTDAPAHANNHRLAVHHFKSSSKCFTKVLGDQLQPLLRAHQSFELSHLVLSRSCVRFLRPLWPPRTPHEFRSLLLFQFQLRVPAS